MAGLYDQFDAGDKAKVSFGPGITLTVLSDFHPAMRRHTQSQRKRYRTYLDMTEIPEDIAVKMDVEKATAAVEAWEGDGITGRNGEPLPYSRENVKQVMTDLPWLRREVLIACLSKATFQRQELADMGKDSALPSEQSSPTPIGATSSGP